MTVIGSDKKFSNYVSVNYHQVGEASIDASNSNNFITITKYCKKKKLTTTFENIPGDNASYNFVVDSNISGFKVVDINQQELVDIEATVYSGSIISITKVGNDWVYNIQPPEIISKDGSVNIENTEDGLNKENTEELYTENDHEENHHYNPDFCAMHGSCCPCGRGYIHIREQKYRHFPGRRQPGRPAPPGSGIQILPLPERNRI